MPLRRSLTSRRRARPDRSLRERSPLESNDQLFKHNFIISELSWYVHIKWRIFHSYERT
jgi:hypothetical protein